MTHEQEPQEQKTVENSSLSAEAPRLGVNLPQLEALLYSLARKLMPEDEARQLSKVAYDRNWRGARHESSVAYTWRGPDCTTSARRNADCLELTFLLREMYSVYRAIALFEDAKK